MKVDGVGKIVEGVNALEAALNSNRVKKVVVLDTKHNWKKKKEKGWRMKQKISENIDPNSSAV